MEKLLLFSVWVHMIAMVVWLGGMSTLALVFVPLTREGSLREAGRALLSPLALRFRRIAWISLLVLVITGGINTIARGISPSDVLNAPFYQGAYGQTFALKLLLVATVLSLSYVHDFRIGPRLAEVQQSGGAEGEMASLRRRVVLLARVNAALALAILFLAVMLSRGGFF